MDAKQHSRAIELLSPAKNAETAIEAIKHGADAVYIGAAKFGARSSAGNGIDDIARVVDFAHPFGAKVYATVNTIIYDNELKAAERLISQLYKAGVDALIVQDMGILRLDIPPIQLHASTQCDTRTTEKAQFLDKVGFSQIVLARELSVGEIRNICNSVEARIECFVHGALCVSYSGRCHASCSLKGRSANRGECAQICRLPYDVWDENRKILQNKHILSLKDFNQSNRLEELLDAGVSSLKIEGRLKDIPYVKNITAFYSNRINEICKKYPDKYQRSSNGNVELKFEPNPKKSFNRGFTHYFFDNRQPESPMASLLTPKSLGEKIGKVAAIANKGFAISGSKHLSNGDGLVFFDQNSNLCGFRANKVEGNTVYPLENVRIARNTLLYRNFDKAFTDILTKDSATRSIEINVEMRPAKSGIATTISDAAGCSITLCSDFEQIEAKSNQLDARKRIFSKLGDTPYRLGNFDIDGTENLFIPASTLTEIRRQAIAKFSEAKKINYRFEYRKPEDSSAKYISDKLDYADNVANHMARKFYESHGVNAIEPAMETSATASSTNPILMTTRYCLRRELGCCLKGTNANKIGRNITIESGNIRMAVEVHSKNCQMVLRKC